MRAEHVQVGATVIVLWPMPTAAIVRAALPAINYPGYVTFMVVEQEIEIPAKKELTLINGIPVLV